METTETQEKQETMMRMSIDVVYGNNKGVPEDKIKAVLNSAFEHLLDNGFLSGDLDLEVDCAKCEIKTEGEITMEEETKTSRKGRTITSEPNCVFTPKVKKESQGVFSIVIPFNDNTGARIEKAFILSVKNGDVCFEEKAS